MEATGFIAILQQIDLEPGVSKYVREQFIVVHNLMVGGRMIRRTRAARLHRPLIGLIAEVGVGYGAAKIAAGLKKIVTQPCSRSSFRYGKMLPYMLA